MRTPRHFNILLYFSGNSSITLEKWYNSLIPVFKESVSKATPPEIQNAIAGRRKIVTVGDSITEAGKYPGGCVWLLQRYLNALDPGHIEIVNAGISGNKATDMQARFQKDAIDPKTRFSAD
ncbi:SGNH/GDSL hydrolase family protein, partial [Microcoleus sp. F4-D5]|uniref:SGNH/GDSL hydrolase family protein n=1 Tax=Microcoleus sp. F4-D5 TaxID=2818760 RepID=UPI003B122AE5